MSITKSVAACQRSCLLFSCTLLTIFFLLPITADSISFRFHSFDIDTNNIVYEGDAVAREGEISLNRVDFLTRVGRATYADNVRIWDPSTQELTHFSTRFSFTIDTTGTIGSPFDTYGHGLVFFLAPSNTQIPPNSAGGFLGLFNTTTLESPSSNHIVGVEFDSFPNPEWDPPAEHVGVIVNSLSSAAYVLWDMGMHACDVGHVRINYDANAKRLDVSLTYENSPERNYKVCYDVDLREILPEWVKIGFSAATGSHTESHVVHYWEFNSTLEGTQPNPSVSRISSSNQNRKVRWLAGGMIFMSVLLTCALILAFWVVLRMKRKGIAEETGTISQAWPNDNSERAIPPQKFFYGVRAIAAKGGQM